MDIPVSDAGLSGSSKWGYAALAGYQAVPDALLIKQRELKLDPVDMLVLLNLASYWWFQNRPPFARTNVIAKRMGVSVRTVQRSLQKLERSKLVRRDDFTDDTGIVLPAVYLDGLVEKLNTLTKSDATLMGKIMRIEAQHSSAQEEEIPF